MVTTYDRPKTERNTPTIERRVSPDDIAHRAFELYSARGGEDGHDLDDWLRAERELTGAGAGSRQDRL